MAEVVFYNNSRNADTYVWDFGDGSSSTSANPTHTYVATGAYVIRLTASRGGVQARSQRVVAVKGGATVNFLTTARLDIMTTNAGDQITVD